MAHFHQSATGVEVVFVSPPAYYPWVIPPGIAYLAGYLEQKGVSTVTLDANVQALEYLLVKNAPVAARATEALEALRDLGINKDWRHYEAAMRYLAGCARDASAGSERLTFTRNTLRYYPAYELRSRAGLLQAALNWEEHLFTSYYIESLVPQIKQLQPQSVAISATDLHQLLPATVLCAVLRRQLGPSTPELILGGNVFARIYDTISIPDESNAALLKIWGTVIVGEGERSLLEAAHALREDRSIENLEGAIHLGEARPAKQSPIALDELALPKCDGFRPLVPKMPIPLNVYRGCYYAGICTFCDINQGYDSVWTSATPQLAKTKRRFRGLPLIIEDIKSATKRYDTTLFNFTDEWFVARDMTAMAEELVDAGIRIQWDAYCRFESALAQPATARLLARAGARFFQFGLESATLRTLKAVGKGILPELSSKVLQCLAKAGIWNHVFLIVGLPGEYLHEMLLTIAFILDNSKHILTIKPTRFQLARYAPIAKAMNDPHLDVKPPREEELDLALNRPFQYRAYNFCTRCGGGAIAAETHCPVCKDQLISRPFVSRRAVNVMYTAMELIAANHWAYPFTSLYPYHTRMLFQPEDALRISLERSETTDRTLGLSERERIKTFQSLCRFLEWEFHHVAAVREIYDSSGLELPSGWENPNDLVAFARRWAQACAPSTVAVAVA